MHVADAALAEIRSAGLVWLRWMCRWWRCFDACAGTRMALTGARSLAVTQEAMRCVGRPKTLKEV